MVATPGARAGRPSGGYGAVLLLDTWAMLTRADLRAGRGGDAPVADRGGAGPPGRRQVVVVADGSLAPVQALLRWDPGWFAARELAERRELGFPPAARMASLTGRPRRSPTCSRPRRLPAGAEVLGPVPAGDESGADAGAGVARPGRRRWPARCTRPPAVRSARKAAQPVRIQVDPLRPVLTVTAVAEGRQDSGSASTGVGSASEIAVRRAPAPVRRGMSAPQPARNRVVVILLQLQTALLAVRRPIAAIDLVADRARGIAGRRAHAPRRSLRRPASRRSAAAAPAAERLADQHAEFAQRSRSATCSAGIRTANRDFDPPRSTLVIPLDDSGQLIRERPRRRRRVLGRALRRAEIGLRRRGGLGRLAPRAPVNRPVTPVRADEARRAPSTSSSTPPGCAREVVDLASAASEAAARASGRRLRPTPCLAAVAGQARTEPVAAISAAAHAGATDFDVDFGRPASTGRAGSARAQAPCSSSIDGKPPTQRRPGDDATSKIGRRRRLVGARSVRRCVAGLLETTTMLGNGRRSCRRPRPQTRPASSAAGALASAELAARRCTFIGRRVPQATPDRPTMPGRAWAPACSLSRSAIGARNRRWTWRAAARTSARQRSQPPQRAAHDRSRRLRGESAG